MCLCVCVCVCVRERERERDRDREREREKLESAQGVCWALSCVGRRGRQQAGERSPAYRWALSCVWGPSHVGRVARGGASQQQRQGFLWRGIAPQISTSKALWSHWGQVSVSWTARPCEEEGGAHGSSMGRRAGRARGGAGALVLGPGEAELLEQRLPPAFGVDGGAAAADR